MAGFSAASSSVSRRGPGRSNFRNCKSRVKLGEILDGSAWLRSSAALVQGQDLLGFHFILIWIPSSLAASRSVWREKQALVPFGFLPFLIVVTKPRESVVNKIDLLVRAGPRSRSRAKMHSISRRKELAAFLSFSSLAVRKAFSI